MKAKARVGLILRCDDLLQEFGFKKTIVETDFGQVDRVYLGEIAGVSVAVLYGRFKGMRTPSRDIDYMQNQAVLSELGVSLIIGTFIVGAISPEHIAGDIFMPHDFVGLGGYSDNLRIGVPFKNVDMFQPFCPQLRHLLAKGAQEDQETADLKTEAIYAAFTGYPRIETKAELEFYQKMGWDIVGQTLDAEATLARQMKCHYAALCALTDDISYRQKYIDNPIEARRMMDMLKVSGRKKMERIILNSLKYFDAFQDDVCSCAIEGTSEQNFFRHRPTFEQ
jgi:5'-methylthioadenosine phosphorylase